MKDNKIKTHLLEIEALIKDFSGLSLYIEENGLEEYFEDDIITLINSEYYQLHWANYDGDDEYFDSYEDYTEFTINLIQENLERYKLL